MSTDLAPEDALRLHVLLAGELHAVRIDESAMTLHALTPKGVARIGLHPNCRPDLYLMRVRELLGGHALDFPGAYPVYLRHWMRTGHANPKNLAALLKLGEPEAVAAVALAPELTEELARRAWWVLPNREIACCLLGQPAVRASGLGAEIAAFLVEHLPFEQEPLAAIDIIRAVVGAGLLDEAESEKLWLKGKHRPHYYIGFLEHRPDELPGGAERELPAAVAAAAGAGDPLARLLVRCYSASGQSFLRAAELVLEKPPVHEAVYLTLDILGRYFAAARDAVPGTVPPTEAAALVALACSGKAAAEPVLTRTTAVGPLMRRHLESVLAPLLAGIRVLRGVP